MERCHDYFESISTEEFVYPPIPRAVPTTGLVLPITEEETSDALKRTKVGKATGPDDLAAYRPILLLSHTMKVFGRILDQGLATSSVYLPTSAALLMGAAQPIPSLPLVLIEKQREKRKSLQVAFLILEKPFDRVPPEVIWYALPLHVVPEALTVWVQLLYADPSIIVQAAAGTLREFAISIGVR